MKSCTGNFWHWFAAERSGIICPRVIGLWRFFVDIPVFAGSAAIIWYSFFEGLPSSSKRSLIGFLESPLMDASLLAAALYSLGISYIRDRLKTENLQAPRLWFLRPGNVLNLYRRRFGRDHIVRILFLLRLCCLVAFLLGAFLLASRGTMRSREASPLPASDTRALLGPGAGASASSPMDANYQTAFEIGLRSFPWAFFAIPMGFVIVGGLLVRYPRGKQIRQAVGGILVIFSILGIVLIGGGAIADFVEYRSAYAREDFSVLEGAVDNFHPMPYEGHQQESFTVNGVAFYYSDFDSSPCFHNSASHGGPIRPGLGVRIVYHQGCILRLDIRR
jgi:hypothetical protein